jgi:flagellar biosynthesis regulator FlaF
MYYNAMKKNISRVKEALTRALNTIDAARDPANFLSSETNYFTRRAISSPIFRECKKPLKNAAFLHV